MTKSITIAVDAMGGDNSPRKIIDAIELYHQENKDINFKQLELSVREIGYGDSTINKNMKQYINIFYSIINKVENWEKIKNDQKCKIFSEFIDVGSEAVFFVNYFEKYRIFLTNNTLNHFTKDVISFKF